MAAMIAHGIAHPQRELPFGAILGVGYLAKCVPITRHTEQYIVEPDLTITVPPPEPELSFGNYQPDRYAWVFSRVIAFETPVPQNGRQGLWRWTVPDSLAAWLEPRIAKDCTGEVRPAIVNRFS